MCPRASYASHRWSLAELRELLPDRMLVCHPELCVGDPDALRDVLRGASLAPGQTACCVEHDEFIDCVAHGSDQYECTMLTRGDPFAKWPLSLDGHSCLRDAGIWLDDSTVRRLSAGRRREPVEPVRFLTLPPPSTRGGD